MNANNTYFENLKRIGHEYEERRAAHESKKQHIIDTYGWDSEELKNWYAEKEAMTFPFEQGACKAYRAWAQSISRKEDELEMDDFLWEREVKDFIGSYSQYREFMKDLEAEKRSRAREEERAAKAGNSQESGSGQTQSRPDAPRKLSYKEQRELERLEKDIESLTAEKEDLESRMNGGLTDPAELQKVTTRFAEVSSELDAKETRWLELSVQ